MSTQIVTTEVLSLLRTRAPALPYAPPEYNRRYQDELNNILRLYFNTLDAFIGQLMANSATLPISIGGTNVDAFGRLRVSNPYTLFDSQNRFAKDNQFSEELATGGTATFVTNESSVDLAVTTSSGSKAVRQSFRVFPYQPGKGLLVLCTFVMGAKKANLRQRVGYFNTSNGVFLQLADTGEPQFVLRTNTSGTPSDARAVSQSSWNGDKLDGTGDSGLTLDLTKAQILWMDFEWLGVGSVRCGFIINEQYIVCHTFNNANDIDKVYMTTAILPVRYEVENTAGTASTSTLKQICSTVISEGGFQSVSQEHVARRTTAFTNIDTTATFFPIVSIRLASGRTGAVVLPNKVQFLPLTSQNYEVALLKNPTLTGATWAATVDSDSNVEFDVGATAISAVGTLLQTTYITSTGSGGTQATELPTGYNWDLQLGATVAGTSDVLTLAVRTVSGATKGDGVGSISFYDLTQ